MQNIYLSPQLKLSAMYCRIFSAIALSVMLYLPANAQNTGPEQLSEQLRDHGKNLSHRLDQLQKLVDDVLWQQKTGDVAPTHTIAH
jgi:hypothetical protein